MAGTPKNTKNKAISEEFQGTAGRPVIESLWCPRWWLMKEVTGHLRRLCWREKQIKPLGSKPRTMTAAL